MRQHTASVEAQIRAIPALVSKVGVSVMPRANGALVNPPYVVIHPADGVDTAERSTLLKKTHNPRFTLHIVGSSYDNAQTVTELIKARFVVNGKGVRLAIEGENTHPVRWSQPIPSQVDDSVSPPFVYNVIELAFQSDEKE